MPEKPVENKTTNLIFLPRPGVFETINRWITYLVVFIQNGVRQIFQKRYQDGKMSLLLLAVSLPIQILAWGWLAYQYFWTGEVIFTIPAEGQFQKYAGLVFFSPALLFFWPFALWYFPYLSGGGKLAMTLFSLAIYRMTAWCTQILYRWYWWQEQLHQLQTEAANQLGYINNTITDWYGLVYIKFKETGPIYQHNAEYLIQQQLNRFQVGNWSDFAQKHGQLAAQHFQEKLEEIREFSMSALANRLPEDLDPAQTLSPLLEQKILAELPRSDLLGSTGSPLQKPWWQQAVEKMQAIDWSNPQIQTVAWAIGGLVALGVAYWGVNSLLAYFGGEDRRLENLAGIVTNHEQDVSQLMAHLQKANESQKQDILALLQGIQDNHKLSQETASQLLTLQDQWLQPQVQNLVRHSAELLSLVELVDPGSFGLTHLAVKELKGAVEQILILQEKDKTALWTLSDHFYQMCNRLNMHIATELRPSR